jgi:hypothetical protein
MIFYILRVLFPALLIDIVITTRFLRKETLPKKNVRTFGALVATGLLYFTGALAWIVILDRTDLRFQGQGAIGLIIIFVIGVAFTVVRSLFGLILFSSLKSR